MSLFKQTSGASTKPPETATFRATFTQWQLYDKYVTRYHQQLRESEEAPAKSETKQKESVSTFKINNVVLSYHVFTFPLGRHNNQTKVRRVVSALSKDLSAVMHYVF